MPTTDICVYMHEEAPFFQENKKRLLDITKGDFELHVICEPGSVHQNMNRALRTAKRDRVVLLDDDVWMMDSEWLLVLNDLMNGLPLAGEIGMIETKTKKSRDWYMKGGKEVVAADQAVPAYFEVPWLPGFCVLLDRGRTGPVYVDETIPFPTGSSDVDLSLVVKECGWKCYVSTRVCCFHEWKGSEEENKRCTAPRDQQQIQHMYRRWGDTYLQAISAQVGVLLDHTAYLSNPHVPELIEQQVKASTNDG